MRLHLILPFIGWVFKKAFSGVIRVHEKYQYEMGRMPFLMIFTGTLLSIVFTAFSVLLMTAVFGHETIMWTFYIVGWSSVSYVIYSFVSSLFKNFLDERKELFETIKR